MNHRCLGREAKPSQPKRRRFWPRKRQKKKKREKEIHCVATTSLASKSIPKSHFIINYSLADCIWWPSFRRFSLTKKKLQNKKEKRKKRIHTYLRALREMEKLLLSLSLLSEDSTSDCVVESESSELSSKRKSMLEASMYYMQFCFCTMSVFLFTLDFEKFFTLIFSSTKCVKWLFSTFQPRVKKFSDWFGTFVWEKDQYSLILSLIFLNLT